MRKTTTLLTALVFSLASIAYAHHGPATAKIDAAAKKQPAVTFPHDKHVKAVKSCDTCHHTNKGLTAATDKDVKKCSSCHMKAQGKTTSMADMSLTKNPMHARCLNCHKTNKKGPTVCAKCHVK